MRPWGYASRLISVRGNRKWAQVARLVSRHLGATVTTTSIRQWEGGATPRRSSEVEAWVRLQEAPKPQPPPRTHIGVSFEVAFDTTTAEEAHNFIAMLEGVAALLRARWPLQVGAAASGRGEAVEACPTPCEAPGDKGLPVCATEQTAGNSEPSQPPIVAGRKP